ncbi:MAG: transcriptional repressor LexA [Eggerthella lenta]
MAEKVTKRQQAVLDCIEECIREGYSPTARGLPEPRPSSSTVRARSAREKGLINAIRLRAPSPSPTSSRSARWPPAWQPSFSNIVNVPSWQHGRRSPILAEENITDTLSLPTEIVGDAPSFLLSVRGESMIEAGINDGDYVVVKEQPVANNGDIVVAIIDDGATVKRFFKESDHIRLQPENSTMDPIITTDCAIAGKVVAVFRRL